MAMGQAPVGLPFAALAGLVWFFVLIETASRPVLTAWIAAAFYFATSMFWIVEPFLVDPVRHGALAPFALIGLSGGLAVFWLAAVWMAHRLVLGRFGTVLCLSLSELARGYVLTGFPWGLVGYGWLDTPAMGWAAWIGPFGLTALTFMLGSLGAAAVLSKRSRFSGGAFACLLVILIALPLLRTPKPVQDAPSPRIRIIQPNAEQHLKWDPDWALVFFGRQLDFTAQPAQEPLDLIVWPETAIPYLLHNAKEPLNMIAQASGGVPVALGVQRGDGENYFNSTIVIGSDAMPRMVYDKHHLVPFGEYIPFSAMLGRSGMRGLAALRGSGYSPGPGPRILDLENSGRVLPLICYEAVFPQDLRIPGDRADWIMQLTNDAWFGRIAGPYQHLAQARFRAVEQGLPMVRAANTGVSALIDANGDVLRSFPLGAAGFIDVTLPPAFAPTPYARFGDGPVVFVLLLLGIGVFLRRRVDSYCLSIF